MDGGLHQGAEMQRCRGADAGLYLQKTAAGAVVTETQELEEHPCVRECVRACFRPIPST